MFKCDMSIQVERTNAEKVKRQFTNRLAVMEFVRTKPAFYTRRSSEHIVEVISLSKRSLTPEFRIYATLHVLNDPSDALNGFASDHYVIQEVQNHWYKKYNFRYYVADQTADEIAERCVSNLVTFVEEEADPWFMKWRDLGALANSSNSPLCLPSRDALKRSMANNVDLDTVRKNLKGLGLQKS
jgi:hypothetical protein